MIKKVLYVVLIVICIICIIPGKSFSSISDDAVGDAESFISKAGSTDEVIDSNSVQNFSDDVFNILLAFGMVIAVIVGIIIGIQFMISSVDERAKVKETLVVYVIGVVVLVGAFSIWKIIVNLLNNV